jgi:hypothetical protein
MTILTEPRTEQVPVAKVGTVNTRQDRVVGLLSRVAPTP